VHGGIEALLRSVGKDGTTESELQNMDTKDPTKSAKKCMKNAMLCNEDCTKEGKCKGKNKNKRKRKARQWKARQGSKKTG